jgi:hypothetical protein
VLLDNNAGALTINANGSFVFATALASGTSYQVSVGTQPSGQTCTVANGGPISISANVTDVQVSCKTVVAGADLVAERVLAQTGLAIALASTVLQSQLQILLTSFETSASCRALTGGGSVMGTAANTVTVYYDTACTQPYIVATPTVTATFPTGGAQYVVAETATYYSLSTGAAIGTMVINETAFTPTATTASTQLYGTGIFTPAGVGTTPVQLGLYCSIPGTDTSATSINLQCAGGVAQDFPALNLAIGAVTPMTLTVGRNTAGAATNVTFTGSGSPVTGPLGSLTLTNPSPTSLVINGGSAYTTITAGGGAASFALFPPTPTSWDLTDATDNEQFQISVTNDTTRNLSMTITQTSSGGSLASAALDQSGTGSITYSDGSTAAITSWTLAD